MNKASNIEKKEEKDSSISNTGAAKIYDALKSELAGIPAIISITPGKNISESIKSLEVNDSIKIISKIVSYKTPAFVYGKEVFLREFNEKCDSYKACSTNLCLVLNDSMEAMYVKYKRNLINEGFSKDILNEVRSNFSTYSQELSQAMKEELDNKYIEGYEELKKTIGFIADDSDERINNIEIRGGGFGVKGAILGAIGAQLATSFSASYINNKAKSFTKRSITEFEEFANELYLGDATIDFCIKLLKSSLSLLVSLLIINFYGDEYKFLEEYDEIAKNLEFQSRSLSNELLLDLSCELLSKFPFDEAIYDFLCYNYSNFISKVPEIVTALSLPDNFFTCKDTWDIEVPGGKVITYKDALTNQSDKKMGALLKYEKHASTGELIYRLAFRMRLKALLENSIFYNDAVNKYIWDCSNNALIEVAKKEWRYPYILMCNKYSLLSDTGIIIKSIENELFTFTLNEFKEMFVVNGTSVIYDGTYVVILLKTGKRYRIEIPPDLKEEFTTFSDIINIALNIDGKDKTLLYDNIQKHRDNPADYYYYCNKCGYTGSPMDNGFELRCKKCLIKANSYEVSRTVTSPKYKERKKHLKEYILKFKEETDFKDEYLLADNSEITVDLIHVAMGELPEDIDTKDYREEKEYYYKRLKKAESCDYFQKFLINSYNCLTNKDALEKKLLRIESIKTYLQEGSITNLHGFTIDLAPLSVIDDFLQNKDIALEYIVYYDKIYMVTDEAFYLIDVNNKVTRYPFNEWEFVPIGEVERFVWNSSHVYLKIHNQEYTFTPVNTASIIDEKCLVNTALNIVNVAYAYSKEKVGISKIRYCESCRNIFTYEHEKQKRCPHCDERINKFGWAPLWCTELQNPKDVPEDVHYEIKRDLGFLEYVLKQYADTIKKEASPSNNIGAAEETMYCIFCGKNIKRVAKFCNFCGKENKYHQ